MRPPLARGQRVHLRHSTDPVNGTVTRLDRLSFTVRWDGPRGGKYRYPYSQLHAFGSGYRRAPEDAE